MTTVITIEDIWKEYRLGVIGHGTLARDLQSWWAKLRGKDDPNSLISQFNKSTVNRIKEDRFWALRNINIEIKQGQVVGIIGKNGAGKSTLLKLLSRVTLPTKGEIKIKGTVASLLEVGTGFHPELTGRENIFMNGAILGMTKSEIRLKIDEIISFSGVEKFIDTPVKRYSSGMRVRLGFSIAAHLEPEILIIDEVLAVGDAEFQKRCLGKMGEVARAGRTVLFVSHNMASIQNLCDRGVILDSGNIGIDGNINEVVSTYLEQIEDKRTYVSVNDRKDRIGGDRFRFINVEFIDRVTNNISINLLSGNKVKIVIYFNSREHIDNVLFTIAFFSTNGHFICSCSSRVLGISYKLAPGLGSVTCYFDNFPLSHGAYLYKLRAEAKNEILDQIENVGMVNVVGGDYYKTGMLPPDNRASVLVDYRYENQSI